MMHNTKEIQVVRLRLGHLDRVLGIGTAAPSVSWSVETAVENWYQSSYEIKCYPVEETTHESTDRVESSQSVQIEWPFAPLKSRTRCRIRVRVWGDDGTASDWSTPLEIETGLLASDQWKGFFITPVREENKSESNPLPYFRRAFNVDRQVESVRLYVTALGLYEAYLNGEKVGDEIFAPGWTSYDRHLCYQTYDVTALISPGENALGAVVAEGWFRGRIGFEGGRKNIWGENSALLMQLEIRYNDGSEDVIATDEKWKTSTGSILRSSIYDGETCDVRLEQDGWNTPGFDSSAWEGVRKIEWNFNILSVYSGPPVRRIEKIRPQKIFTSPSGKTLVDFGQNLVGRISVNVKGNTGDMITVRHAEVLEKGELGTRPLRQAEATDRYILKGSGEEQWEWEPKFTFHGFRYAEIEGWPGQLHPEDLYAVVIHSDMERTGYFETSNPLINRLHENVVWSMRGNFLSIPTDCPQRDERLGWTGDLQIFSPAALFLYDAAGFLHSWLKDLAIEQEKIDGAVPPFVPNALGEAFGAAGWGDAATVVPWNIYRRYGDIEILATQFDSMCSWIDYVASKVGDTLIWDSGFQFGDWLDPTAPPDRPGEARTSKEIVATAFFYRSAHIVAESAKILGFGKKAVHYSKLAERVKDAFVREYVTPSGRMICDAETAYAIAIAFNLTGNDAQRQYAGDRLAELVRDGGYHIRTGFVGTPLICDALCDTGHHRAAYRLLKQEECPSWLYPVTMDATTIWERWDSMLPDGSINPGEMTSFNHYAFGAVADWMHRVIGGLSPEEPGYSTIRIAPRPGGGIIHCRTEYRSPYGIIRLAWKISNEIFHLSIEVPPNTTAIVVLPGRESDPEKVGSGIREWKIPYRDPDARGPYTVDDIVGEILSIKGAEEVVTGILDNVNAPGFIRAIIFNEKNVPLREALKLLPDYEKAVELTNEALKNL